LVFGEFTSDQCLSKKLKISAQEEVVMSRAAWYRSLFAVAIAFTGFVSNANSQSADRAKRLVRPPVTNELTPAVPLGQRPRTVVLKMADDPVAVVRSRMPGKQITETDREAIESNLRAKQDAIAPTIEAMGGKVLAKFQNAINGIKVQATPDQIASFAKLSGIVAIKGVHTYHLDNAFSVSKWLSSIRESTTPMPTLAVRVRQLLSQPPPPRARNQLIQLCLAPTRPK
jgi:hypothetical protein